MSYLKVRSLSKNFGHLKALQDVDLELEKGKSIAIFGDNGAGKTTLIKIISTLMNPTSGKIFVNDLDLKTDGDKIRKSLGLVSHSLFLYSELNAIENLRYFGRLYGVGDLDDRITNLLGKFGLLPRMYDSVRTFSRGMLQRLALARAVIHKPDFLLLDEPFTGLDRSASQLLMKYLEEHKAGGGTSLLVTHDLQRGFESADQLAILSEGRMVWKSDSSSLSLDEFKKVYSKNASEGV